MARRRRSRFTQKEIDDALRMAAELELEQIEEKAREFVKEDTRFTWTLAGFMTTALIVIQGDLSFLPWEIARHHDFRAWLGVGMLFILYVILALRHVRIAEGLTIVLAHRLKKSGIIKPDADTE